MVNDGAPVVRYVLSVDQLRQLETSWGGRLPDSFHFGWSGDVPLTERERRDQDARHALRDAGLLVAPEPGRDGPDSLVEQHVCRFLDVLHHPAVFVVVQAWNQERRWWQHLWCDAQWGTGLRRSSRPSPTGTAWADEDAVHLSLAQSGTALTWPLDLFEQVRNPDDERAVVAAPVALSLAASVAAVAAWRPDRHPDVAYEMLHQIGADWSGEPFRSLAAGIEAGFEVTVAASGIPAQHGMYLQAQGLWVSVGARIDSVLAQVAAGNAPPSGPELADTATIRLAPVSAGAVIADYLTAVTALPVTAPHQGADQ